MGLVQIEESELATLRQERNDARTRADELSNTNREMSTKLEKAEADVQSEKTRADNAEAEKTKLEESSQRATLKDKRVGELGQGFLAKLGEFTRQRLDEQAGTLSDEEWDAALKEREELAGVARNTKAEEGGSQGGSSSSESGGSSETGSSFSNEEVASFTRNGVTSPVQPSNGAGGAARQLARAFQPKRRQPETAGK